MPTNHLPVQTNQAVSYSEASASAAPQPTEPITESGQALRQLFLAFLTWVASWLFLLIVPLLVALPYIVYQIRVQHGFRPELLANDKTIILLSLLGVIPAHALSIFVAWAVVTSWGKRPFWETIRWSWPDDVDSWRRVLLIVETVLLAAALLAVGWLITWILGGGETQIDQLIKSSSAARITTAFLAAATAPFVEEVIYRGVLYPAVDRAFGTVWAVLVVSVMFAGVHLLQYSNNLGVIAVVSMLSIALTLVRARTGRLLPCFLIHLVFNGIQSISIVASPYLESTPHPDKTAGAISHMIELFITRLG